MKTRDKTVGELIEELKAYPSDWVFNGRVDNRLDVYDVNTLQEHIVSDMIEEAEEPEPTLQDSIDEMIADMDLTIGPVKRRITIDSKIDLMQKRIDKIEAMVGKMQSNTLLSELMK